MRYKIKIPVGYNTFIKNVNKGRFIKQDSNLMNLNIPYGILFPFAYLKFTHFHTNRFFLSACKEAPNATEVLMNLRKISTSCSEGLLLQICNP